MERKDSCVACESTNPLWPVRDMSTGFLFCGGCYRKTRDYLSVSINQQLTGYTIENFAAWLRAIAFQREKMGVKF